ncbi:MAG: fibronectin type III domain-containing protein, partial [Muribaculaceae bacterium]|nr:fibronectin type III domain-containing protein [Muribaculaceae bacterium]
DQVSPTVPRYNMKLNIFGASCKYWLVTPEFNLSQNLSFDLALTDYGNADPIENDTLQADDRFIVLIYANDAWHILREWNNSGSEYVYNAISATGENVSIDLSAYYGQDVKIAFYGESTATGGDNDLHIDNVICGTPYEAGEWQTITTTETTVTIPDLTPETAYEVKVQGDCGELDGLSLETDIVTFTTLEGCPVPQNVEVDNITYNSATVTWDGYNDSYNVSYRMAAHANGIIEHFDVSTLPSGWTKWSGLVDDILADSATLSTTTIGWYTNNTYALGTYNAKVNIYGQACKYWLVSPEFRPSQDLDFDLALTRYNSALPIANDSTAQLDDRFIVLIYADDAWHILREWNNSGSEYVYNAISAEGEHATIDLSAYYGKKVKIAFYGESTESGGDNDLHIDNIVCGTPVEAGEWETVEAPESPVVLTGLTPETPYEVKVQGVCGDTETEWTEIQTFTTLEQTTVTQTIALAQGWNWVSTYVEITLDDLKAALLAAYPDAAINQLVIKGNGVGQTAWNPNAHRWIGQLTTMDLSQMYMVKVPAAGEITLEGMPIDVATLELTINPGVNWIAFPLSQGMSLADAFAGFSTNQDVVKGNGLGQATWNNNAHRWVGQLQNLVPGQGYIYNSKATESKPFYYPAAAK